MLLVSHVGGESQALGPPLLLSQVRCQGAGPEARDASIAGGSSNRPGHDTSPALHSLLWLRRARLSVHQLMGIWIGRLGRQGLVSVALQGVLNHPRQWLPVLHCPHVMRVRRQALPLDPWSLRTLGSLTLGSCRVYSVPPCVTETTRLLWPTGMADGQPGTRPFTCMSTKTWNCVISPECAVTGEIGFLGPPTPAACPPVALAQPSEEQLERRPTVRG